MRNFSYCSCSHSELICFCAVKPGHPSTININMSLFQEKNLTPGRLIDNVFLEARDYDDNLYTTILHKHT